MTLTEAELRLELDAVLARLSDEERVRVLAAAVRIAVARMVGG